MLCRCCWPLVRELKYWRVATNKSDGRHWPYPGPRTMTQCEAQELKFRCDPEYATAHSCPVLRTRHDMQRESCWSVAEKVEMIDTCFQGWICPPIYVINHLELTEVAPDGEDHVFDGAHKLEAVFEFMAGKFPLKATPTSCAEIKEHTGKLFEVLPLALKTKIRKYRFVINVIDDETAHDISEPKFGVFTYILFFRTV